jgi:hypothetical protein
MSDENMPLQTMKSEDLFNAYRSSLNKDPDSKFLTWEQIRCINNQHFTNVRFIFRSTTDRINRIVSEIHAHHTEKDWGAPELSATSNRSGIVSVILGYNLPEGKRVEIRFDMDSQVVGTISLNKALQYLADNEDKPDTCLERKLVILEAGRCA